ncbi:MAG: hypothetical protein MI794_05935 [Pseudomonadales bacterium]|nr:hypothetical protein [Pseudomonadales bacterium]
MSAPATKKLTPPIVALGQPIAEFNENGYRNIGELNGVLESIDDSAAWVDGRAEDADSAVSDAQQAVTEAVNQVALAQQQVALAADQVQLAKDEVDNAQDVADNVAAQANFGGLWSNLFGAVSPPLSVYHRGGYWQLLTQLENATSVEPGTDSGIWLTMSQTSLEIGGVTYSYADLTKSGLFVKPGMKYLQSEYPELFDVIGIGRGIPIQPSPFPGPITPTHIYGDVCVTAGDSYLIVANPQGSLSVYRRNGLSFFSVDVEQIGFSSMSVNVCALSDDAFAISFRGGDFSLQIYRFDPGRDRFNRVYEGGGYSALDISFCPVTSKVAIGTSDKEGYIKILDIDPVTYQPVVLPISLSSNPSKHQVDKLTWNPSGTKIYATDYDNKIGSPWESINVYSLDGGLLTKRQVPNEEVGYLPRGASSMSFDRSGQYLVVGTNGDSGANGVVLIARVDHDVHDQIFRVPLGAGRYGTDVKISSDASYVVVSTQRSSDGFRIYTQESPSEYVERLRLNEVGGMLDLSIDERILFLGNNDELRVVQPDYHFDPISEFYVPDIQPLSPVTVGDWVPSARGEAYVRAK